MNVLLCLQVYYSKLYEFIKVHSIVSNMQHTTSHVHIQTQSAFQKSMFDMRVWK